MTKTKPMSPTGVGVFFTQFSLMRDGEFDRLFEGDRKFSCDNSLVMGNGCLSLCSVATFSISFESNDISYFLSKELYCGHGAGALYIAVSIFSTGGLIFLIESSSVYLRALTSFASRLNLLLSVGYLFGVVPVINTLSRSFGFVF